MDGKKVIYIAGPITGVKNYWEAFEKIEDDLTSRGFIVLTPTRIPHNLDDARAMKICLAMIDQADAVYFMPGWEHSTGARLERDYCAYTKKVHTTNLETLEVLWA